MAAQRGNLFDGAVPDRGESFVALATIAAADGARVECIVSSDAPDSQLYDQAHDEWVVVIDGRAELEVDGELHVLERGDWITLPARRPHRVRATTRGTRWLAVHGSGGSTPPAGDRDGELGTSTPAPAVGWPRNVR